MRKYLIFIFLASVASLSGALKNINEKSVRVSEALGKVYLLHQQNKFLVEDAYGLHEIDNCWLDSDLRKLAKNEEALDEFLKVGKIEVKKDTRNNYLLRHHVQGLGGGLLWSFGIAAALTKIGVGVGFAGAATGVGAPVGITVGGAIVATGAIVGFFIPGP